MREHAVVGEPATCSYTRARSGRRRERDGEHKGALARSRIPRCRGCLLVLIYEHTNTRIERRYTRESYRKPVSGERRIRTAVKKAARSGAGTARGTFEYFQACARGACVCCYEGV